jgi:hypothetical protein
MGAIASRAVGIVVAGLTGLLATAGLDLTPELQAAVGDFAQTLVNVTMLVAYAVGHKFVASFTGKLFGRAAQ